MSLEGGEIIMTLKLERVRKKITQGELSELSGVSITTISRIEKWGIIKADVKISNLVKLAKALDIPVEELIKEEEV